MAKVASVKRRPPNTKTPVDERLVAEISTLECVLSTLVAWDLSGRPTGYDDEPRCRIGDAEEVLRRSIGALQDLLADIPEALQ
jgi:hypothetical protein